MPTTDRQMAVALFGENEMQYCGLYAPSSLDRFCHQVVEQDLVWEDILTLCRKRSTQLEQWVPETMDEVQLRAHRCAHLYAMSRWHSEAPNA